MVIHSNNEPVIMKFALEKPAFRILVNTVASVGAVGYTTALNPSMTLGPGTIGGSIISDNITAKHLMNIKALAFETNPVNKGNTVTSFKVQKELGSKSSFMVEIEERLRARAGNPPLEHKPVSLSKKEMPASESKIETKVPQKFGEGISRESVDKIIREFKF
jgi:acetaldehyde dehydrogenase (acetylating)